MKVFICYLVVATLSPALIAKEFFPFEEGHGTPIVDLIVETNCNQDTKSIYLTKQLEDQQKLYDSKITFIETELRKTKDQLIQKSLNQEVIEDAMKEKYGSETLFLKRELANSTKSLLQYQRQIEKMKPTEDLKNMIKLNTELASELRKTEDQIAIMQLIKVEGMPGEKTNTRMPASIKNKK